MDLACLETLYAQFSKIAPDHGPISSAQNGYCLKELEECNTDVLFIPPGLTFYLQPCDVYINKPLENKIRASWEAFMQSQRETVEDIYCITFLLNLF